MARANNPAALTATHTTICPYVESFLDVVARVFQVHDDHEGMVYPDDFTDFAISFKGQRISVSHVPGDEKKFLCAFESVKHLVPGTYFAFIAESCSRVLKFNFRYTVSAHIDTRKSTLTLCLTYTYDSGALGVTTVTHKVTAI